MSDKMSAVPVGIHCKHCQLSFVTAHTNTFRYFFFSAAFLSAGAGAVPSAAGAGCFLAGASAMPRSAISLAALAAASACGGERAVCGDGEEGALQACLHRLGRKQPAALLAAAQALTADFKHKAAGNSRGQLSTFPAALRPTCARSVFFFLRSSLAACSQPPM